MKTVYMQQRIFLVFTLMNVFFKHLDNSIKIILVAGFIAGSLDIGAAFLDYYINTGKGPENVLKFISSGIFGKTAFNEDPFMIWFGLLLHFIIAFVFTILFFILYQRIKFLRISVLLSAIIIGIVIWLIMNLIVVPLSNTPKFLFKPGNAIKAALILICAIGLPMILIFKTYFFNEKYKTR